MGNPKDFDLINKPTEGEGSGTLSKDSGYAMANPYFSDEKETCGAGDGNGEAPTRRAKISTFKPKGERSAGLKMDFDMNRAYDFRSADVRACSAATTIKVGR